MKKVAKISQRIPLLLLPDVLLSPASLVLLTQHLLQLREQVVSFILQCDQLGAQSVQLGLRLGQGHLVLLLLLGRRQLLLLLGGGFLGGWNKTIAPF